MDGVRELVPKWLTWVCAINHPAPLSAPEFSSNGHVICHFVVQLLRRNNRRLANSPTTPSTTLLRHTDSLSTSPWKNIWSNLDTKYTDHVYLSFLCVARGHGVPKNASDRDGRVSSLVSPNHHGASSLHHLTRSANSCHRRCPSVCSRTR